MKVSFKYIKQHVDLGEITPEEVADKLTFAGAEVEEILRPASGTNLVIGHILSCKEHPDSDHLHVLQVDEGKKYGVHQIVCGAPNAREGLNVIVARPGAILPKIEIKPSVIRGVESDGMCCSLLELGVDKKYLTESQCAGIEELPEDAPVGEENVLGYLGLDDVAIDLDLLPNRPDLYAFENVAREVGCLFDKPAHFASPKKFPLSKTSFVVGSETEKCPIFTGRVIHDVKTHESPKWLKEFLLTSGIRSINNIVDIGNYIMLVTGQPLNMYDADKLPKAELIVRDDLEGQFLAMDGNKYTLQKGDLVVTSDGKPMCLAGIMTADACRVDENTKNIVVEAAYFAYASIRRTSNRIGLSSDSSLRFCKGINPDIAQEVQEKTTEVLKELAEVGEVEETAVFDVFPHEQKVFETSLAYLNGRLGTSFSEEVVLDTFRRDGMEILESKDGKYKIKIPSYRIDMVGEADLSEELIRIQGYENVVSSLPITELALTGLTPAQAKERQICHFLLSRGLSRIVTYTLESQEDALKFAYLNKCEPYRLKNPMTVDRAVVRPNLLHSLLASASYNVAHQNKDLAGFEVSDVDARGYAGKHLSLVLTGFAPAAGRIGERPYDFYDAKGLVEGILRLLGIGPNRYQVVPWSLGGEELHPGRTAEIRMGKKLLGYIGELHPLCAKSYDLKAAVVAEIDLAALLEMRTGEAKAVIPPRFPSVSRDLAILVGEKVTYEEIRRELLKSSNLLKTVEVFDLYQGKGIPEGKKSIALSLTFAADDRTLKDEEIAEAMKKGMLALTVKFGAEIRGA